MEFLPKNKNYYKNIGCDSCNKKFKDDIRIGTRKGIICIECYAPEQKFLDNLTEFDKRLLTRLRIGYFV